MQSLEANLSKRAFLRPMDSTKTKLITTTSPCKKSSSSNCGQSLNLKPWQLLTNQLWHQVSLVHSKDSLKVHLKKENLSSSFSIHNWTFLMACTKVQILRAVDSAQLNVSFPMMTMALPPMTLCPIEHLLLARPKTHQKQTKTHPNFLAVRAICQNSKS